MRDKLLFGTIGLLIGIVVMQWTMPSSMASYVSPPTGIVAVQGISGLPGHAELLDQNGVQWHCDAEIPWYQRASYPALPVPVASLKFWGETYLVTQSNDVWVMTGDSYSTAVWQRCGPWPGSPVAAQQSTWGKVKANFGGKGDKP